MSTIEPDPVLVAVRLAGACSGALVSLAYMVPRSAREAATRGFAGIASGLVFGAPVGVGLAERFAIIDQLGTAEILLMGSAAASMTAWWVLGALVRIADRAGRGPGF
jgi:hypothetical protein